MKKALIVGYGSIGTRHLKNLISIENMKILILTKRKNLEINQKNVKVIHNLKDALNEKPDFALITNETRYHIPIALKLAKFGLDLFIEKPLSDSYEKDEYEKIRVLGKFDEILKNIKEFKEINDRHSDSKCATRISGVKIDKSQNIEKFTKFWENYVDHVVMVEMSERWDTYNNPIENAGVHPCNFLWGEMYVWYDGKCNPCDVDYKSELLVGNIKENSIKQIWNGEQYKKLRNLHRSGKRNECFPCDHCSNW